MKLAIHLSSIAILVAACSANENMERRTQANTENAVQSTTIRTYNADGKIANAACLIDHGGEITKITSPAKIDLPIAKGEKADDIVITCTLDGTERSAILKSLPANRQGAVLRDGDSGGIASPVNVENGEVSGSVGSIDQVLALGLSTNVIPGDYYIYPKLVNIRF